MHGKGKKYYKNKNIKYEGDFINGKFEGKENLFGKMVIAIQVNSKMDQCMVKEK